MMGGTINVDSKLDEGSIFSITLPYVAADGENDDPDISGLSLVALVDDDVHRGMITECLEQNGAGIVFVETEIELFSRLSASEGSLFVLLGLNSMAENDRVRREASVGADHIKFLSLIVGASEGSAGVSSGCYTIEKWVLLPCSLTGRALLQCFSIRSLL